MVVGGDLLPNLNNVSQMVRRVRKLYRSISVQRAFVISFCQHSADFLADSSEVCKASIICNVENSICRVCTPDSNGMRSSSG